MAYCAVFIKKPQYSHICNGCIATYVTAESPLIMMHSKLHRCPNKSAKPTNDGMIAQMPLWENSIYFYNSMQ